MKKCSVKECSNKAICKGLCNKHYQRLQIHGDVNIVNLRIRPKCSIEGCNKPNKCNTYCDTHYARFKRHGDPLFINPKCNRDGKYKDRHKKYQKVWREKNWPKYLAYLKAKKRRFKQATPPWSETDLIKEFYLKCPEGFHVDHIIPLNGKNVSGLHVLSNLQYLPAKKNLQKSNKY